MLEEIYGWIQDISVYLIVMAAVMHAIPGKDYGKYIRFFSGLVLILMLSSPLLRLAGMEGTFRTLYKGKEYEMERREIERAEELYEQSGIFDLLGTDPGEGTDTGERGRTDKAGIWNDSQDGGEDGSRNRVQDDGQNEGMIEVEEIEIGK